MLSDDLQFEAEREWMGFLHSRGAVTAAGWDESEHPRVPAGTATGGRFTSLEDVRLANPKVDVHAYENQGGGVTVGMLRVLPQDRGQGHASRALDDVLEYADDRGIPAVLDIGHDELDEKVFHGMSKSAKEKWYRSRGFIPNRGRHKDFLFREGWIRPARRKLAAAAFDPSQHPRQPATGGDGVSSPTDGGKFAPKEEAAGQYRKSKIPEALALRDRLYELDAYREMPWLETEPWGDWTTDQKKQLQKYLQDALHEGHYETFWAENLHPPREVQRWVSSGLLSVAYSKEIGMSYAKERGQARSLLKALDNNIVLEDAEYYGFDPAEQAPDLFGEQAKTPKVKQPNPRDQGVPEVYLSESGKFKPGHDAKLKSDLVNSYFELNPTKVERVETPPSDELRKQVTDHWRSHNREEQARNQWTDEQLWRMASGDPTLPSDLRRRVYREAGSRSVRSSTLLHRFDPADAERILEERGWTKYLDSARDKLGGAIVRDLDTANQFQPGLGDQLKKEIGTAKEAWGDSMVIRGERFGRVQSQVSELGHIDPRIQQGLAKKGVEIHVGMGTSTDQDDVAHLADEKARGWGNTYLNKVGGFYSPSNKKVIVSATAPSSRDGLMAHEVGHAIGDVYGIDHHPDLDAWHRRLYPQLRSYFQQDGQGGQAGRQELWAEGVSAVTSHRQQRALDRWPSRGGQLSTGPFKGYRYDDLSPEAKEYFAWVDRMLAEVAEGKHGST